jgi:hypothetical protein
MTIDVATVITDYDWSEKSRPILTIASDGKSATLQIGGSNYSSLIEFSGVSVVDLRQQFEGYVEIFQKAVEVLKSKEEQPNE